MTNPLLRAGSLGQALPGASPSIDRVVNPAHYQPKVAGGVECIDAIKAALGQDGFICFLRGQVLKYTWRLGEKGAPQPDAAKTLWYQTRLVRELELLLLNQQQELRPGHNLQDNATLVKTSKEWL